MRQPYSGFRFGLPCPFPMTITITLQMPPLYPTPLHELDVTQGQLFKRSLTGLNSVFLLDQLPYQN